MAKNGVSRLKLAHVTDKGLKGKALGDALEREFVTDDPVGAGCEREGIKPKRSHGKR